MELTNSIVRQWFPDEDIKVFSNFTSSFFMDEYTATTPLEEAMVRTPRNLSTNLWLYVAGDRGLKTEVFGSKCIELTKALKDANYHTSLEIFAVNNDHMTRINEENYTIYFFKVYNNREDGLLYEFKENIYY